MSAFAHRHTFTDLDAFAAVTGAGGTIVPMARGPWRASISLVGIGGIQLYGTEVPAQIRQGASAPGDLLLVGHAPPGAILHQGHEVEPGDISLVGAGATIDSRFRCATGWRGVQFAPGLLAALAEAWGPRLPRPGEDVLLRLGVRQRDILVGAIDGCMAEAIRSPHLLTHPAAAAALHDSTVHAVARALAGPDQWITLPRATAARRRIARAAVELLAASPGEDWTLTRLAERLGIAPRTLHGAFAAIYGCSPHRFIKRWRMVMVRRALLTHGEDLLVKTAALDHGFWHLGHFALDYRAMFGESPRETQRATRRPMPGWAPPGERPH